MVGNEIKRFKAQPPFNTMILTDLNIDVVMARERLF